MNVWTGIGFAMLGFTSAPGLENAWILAVVGGACIYVSTLRDGARRVQQVNTALAMYEDMVDAATASGLARAQACYVDKNNRAAFDLTEVVNPVMRAQVEIAKIAQADRSNMLPAYPKTKRDN